MSLSDLSPGHCVKAKIVRFFRMPVMSTYLLQHL